MGFPIEFASEVYISCLLNVFHVTNCSSQCLFEVSKIRKQLLAFYKNIKVQAVTTKDILRELNASLNVFLLLSTMFFFCYQQCFSFVINNVINSVVKSR